MISLGQLFGHSGLTIFASGGYSFALLHDCLHKGIKKMWDGARLRSPSSHLCRIQLSLSGVLFRGLLSTAKHDGETYPQSHDNEWGCDAAQGSKLVPVTFLPIAVHSSSLYPLWCRHRATLYLGFAEVR